MTPSVMTPSTTAYSVIVCPASRSEPDFKTSIQLRKPIEHHPWLVGRWWALCSRGGPTEDGNRLREVELVGHGSELPGDRECERTESDDHAQRDNGQHDAVLGHRL